MSAYQPRINESFLMYAMRIEDADHVSGNHVIGLQNIRVRPHRLLLQLMATTKNGLFTVVV